MRTVAISIRTTGCKVNQADSVRIADALRGLPVRLVPPGEPADLSVVNACTVTQAADRDGRANVYRALRTTRGPVFLTGCMAKRLGTWSVPGEERLRVIPETGDHEALIQALKGHILAMLHAEKGEVPHRDTLRHAQVARHARPLIKVQDGCDHACAFCIVPHVRGPSRSVTPSEVVAHVRTQSERGASEVVLTGVDLGAWGADLDPPLTLADLLETLLDSRTGLRFRLSSIEPDRLDDRLIGLIAASPDVCPHLHVPVQSGSDRILRAMRRPLPTTEIASRLCAAAVRIPDLTLGLDILCGFPGEEDLDFQATFSLVRALPVTYLHVFAFSPRPGTEASTLGPAPDHRIVAERCAVLRAYSASRRAERASSMRGRDVEVVDIRHHPSGAVESLSREYFRLLRWDATDPTPGRHRVRVLDARGATLIGVSRGHGEGASGG